MRKQQLEELRRLEEALMETDSPIAEDPWQEDPPADYEIYNTDQADVDMDAYSEDVHAGPAGGRMGLLVVLTILLLAAGIAFLLLKFWEVFSWL